jgi:hypothetical protein
MSGTPTETTPVEQALALLALPSLDDLTTDQVLGITCVWGSSEKALTEEDAVALGPRRRKRPGGEDEWHPRGCPEHVASAAYEALFAHCMGDCEQCSRPEETGVDGVQETSCEVGVTLRRLVIRKGRL